MRSPIRRSWLLALIYIVAATAIFFSPLTATASGTSANDLLKGLVVSAENGGDSYSRDFFRHWIDADGDCQDTRSEVLRRENLGTISGACRVVSGRWVSWFDGVTTISASNLDVDHLVALKEAWESGARNWSASMRERFANDLQFVYTLSAVSNSSNRSKGASDPAEWLPKLNQCSYAQRWVAVKTRWKLSVDQREQSRLSSLLSGTCGKFIMYVPIVSDLGSSTNPSTVPATPKTTVAPSTFRSHHPIPGSATDNGCGHH